MQALPALQTLNSGMTLLAAGGKNHFNTAISFIRLFTEFKGKVDFVVTTAQPCVLLSLKNETQLAHVRAKDANLVAPKLPSRMPNECATNFACSLEQKRTPAHFADLAALLARGRGTTDRMKQQTLRSLTKNGEAAPPSKHCS